METEQSDKIWHYFMGREGNLKEYPRKKSQFFSGKKWIKCLPDGNTDGYPYGTFLAATKYRIRKTDMP